MSTIQPITSGSQWRRWDPHIHTPETLLNDQFDDDWEKYLTEIEQADPPVEALGITDYYSLENYKKVRAFKDQGRLASVSLIFPNIEMRLTVETEEHKAINAHFLFCPDDANHVEMIERALHQLTYEAHETKFHCTPGDLIRFGRERLGKAVDDRAALKEGANQFKVTLAGIRDCYRNTPWMATNCLIAVSGRSSDGTAGLQSDSSFDSLRIEIEKAAHVIFSATDSVRLYWLGKREGFNADHIRSKYGCLKPCIHGSDAHRVEKVLKPDMNRYCWIKGDPTFEALRQTLLEPEGRIFVGEFPPKRIDTSECITAVSTTGTPWLSDGKMGLNPGLVAIIGARGSGKTALADIIARGALADPSRDNDQSFLHRAARHLSDARVILEWEHGEPSDHPLASVGADDYGNDSFDESPAPQETVRYLSQQFVERLCSAPGLHTDLIEEIERVIFAEIQATERYDCSTFQELADLHLVPLRSQREGLQNAIADISAQVLKETSLIDGLPKLTADIKDYEGRIAKTEKEMQKLLPKGDEVRTKRLGEIETALTTLNANIDKVKRRRLRLNDLLAEVANVRGTKAPQHLLNLKQQFVDVSLSDDDWQEFVIDFVGDVKAVIEKYTKACDARIESLSKGDPAVTSTASTIPFNQWSATLLEAEQKNLQLKVGIDAQNRKKYAELQQRLDQEKRTLQRLKDDLEHANGASGRRDQLSQQRRDLYRQCFETFTQETDKLESLYAPLHSSLAQNAGTLQKLRFSVTRRIDLDSWVQRGEALFDLRKDSNLKGHGALLREVKSGLMQAWATGSAEVVSAAMADFIKKNHEHIKTLCLPSMNTKALRDKWNQDVAAWLYSTDHIALSYSMTYEEVPIEQLSPGTRGIVLLLLYLVIDSQDKRPLLIDQPEENLDPKSVYDELVKHFRNAKARRQVIIVTHNANLVVNTDADQVIVAKSDPSDGTTLPTIHYESGSLENPNIRRAVCEILEGGERAFQDRERRYRLQRKDGDILIS